MKYVVDVGGCDNPQDVIKGVEETLEQTNANLVVFGKEELIRSVLSAKATSNPRLEIVNAEETITNNDSPMTAIRFKKNSSLVLALKRLASDEECGAIISAGSTGAVLCGATVILGRKPDVERPTLATLLPSDNGGFVCLPTAEQTWTAAPNSCFPLPNSARNALQRCSTKNPRRLQCFRWGRKTKKATN